MTVRALLALAAACAAAVAGLAVAYRHDPAARWDEAVARYAADHASDGLVDVAAFLGRVGGGTGMAIVAVAAALALARRGRRGEAALAALSYAVTEVASQVLKAVLGRPRPELAPAIELPASAAYPSGHASVALAVLVVAAVLLVRPRAGPWPVAGALLAALAIGASRVVVGVHWTTDVLGGWALGGVAASVLLVLRDRLGRGR